MNWLKEAYYNTEVIVGQKKERINEIYYSFDSSSDAVCLRELSFYSGKGQFAIEIEVAASVCVSISIFINGVPAGDFATGKIAFSVCLGDGINKITLKTCGPDNGMAVKISGANAERIYSPLKVAGATEYGGGCLFYTVEQGKLYRNMAASNGTISRERLYGYKCFDSKKLYTIGGTIQKLVSVAVADDGCVYYIDTEPVIIAENGDSAVCIEKRDGGCYILYRVGNSVNLVIVEADGSHNYLYNILESDEVASAVGGSIFFYKRGGKWWSGEFASYDSSRFDGCICLGGDIPQAGDKYIKLTCLNTVNQPNAALEEGKTAYYICKEGNIFRYADKNKDVVAYCEYYIPLNMGGIMVWSKKLCAYFPEGR